MGEESGGRKDYRNSGRRADGKAMRLTPKQATAQPMARHRLAPSGGRLVRGTSLAFIHGGMKVTHVERNQVVEGLPVAIEGLGRPTPGGFDNLWRYTGNQEFGCSANAEAVPGGVGVAEKTPDHIASLKKHGLC